MNFGVKNGEKNKKEVIGKLRRAQLITTYGPGAIVEMADTTAIIAAIDWWNNRGEKKYEENLQRLCKVDYFLQPKISEGDNNLDSPDIPAFRFPRIHFCPECHRLDDYNYLGDKNKRKCSNCKKTLIPSRFLAACENGHIEDFPYEWWVHKGNIYDCNDSNNHHKLEINFKNDTGGLSSIVIKCTACGKERSMEGCMGKGLSAYPCRGKRPWIGYGKANDENCKYKMIGIQRSASNVYYSVNQSALTIPPLSKKVQQYISNYWDAIKNFIEQDLDKNFFLSYINGTFRDLIDSGRYTAEEIYDQIMIKAGMGQDNGEYSIDKMYKEEYKALCEANSSGADDEFQAESVEISSAVAPFVDEVVKVKRLREVMALQGFRRVNPVSSDEAGNQEEVREFMPLYKTKTNWLPAIEMFGEGIFITLNKEKLHEWEDRIADRYDLMGQRLRKTGMQYIGKGMFSSRYVLLHTMSHLIIRQLTLECGYQEASLKERIYSTYPGDDYEMAGILIYTSSSDSDGSLGGLVRQADADLFETIIRNVLQDASWCSSDPLCSESKAQGFNSLNYAACHACTLLPETSCESRNCLLDRVAVVGEPDNRSLGYFAEVFEDEN